MSFSGLSNRASTGPLYGNVRSNRRLRVMIDADSWQSPGVSSPEEIVFGLLHDGAIQLFRYADDGPPAGTANSPDDASVFPGWAVVRPATGVAPLGARVLVHQEHEDTSRMTPLCEASTVAWATADEDSSNLAGTTPAQRETDAIAALAASALGADIYITNRPYLLQGGGSQVAPEVLLCSTNSALPALGLYLRTQDRFIAARDKQGTIVINSFWWNAALSLIPASWDRLCDADSLDRNSGNNELGYLAAAVPLRITRVLQERDELLRMLSQLQTDATVGSMLAALEGIFLYLMSALDAAARLAHLALELSEHGAKRARKLRNAGWQSPDWVASLSIVCAPLADLVAPDSHGAYVMRTVSCLRNSIHGPALRAAASPDPEDPHPVLVGLPQEDAHRIHDAMEHTGGAASWGLREIAPDQYHVAPATLSDRLITEVANLLNQLLQTIPLESQLDAPYSGGRRPTFVSHAYMSRSIVWQLGLPQTDEMSEESENLASS